MFLSFITLTFLVSVLNVEGQNNNQCGMSQNIQMYDGSDQTRIIGGKKSNPADWPFIVQTKLKQRDGRSPECTGTIISEQWILTAAHCQENGGPAKVFIRGKTYDAEPVINHENYDPQLHINDIQLIKLKQRLQFSRDISNICLFRNVTIENNEIAVAAGYGIQFAGVKDVQSTRKILLDGDDVKFNQNSDLFETPLTIREMDFCQRPQPETYNRICAGGEMMGTSAGDSGGPLMVVRNNRWVQVGVTSDGMYSGVVNNVSRITDRGMYTQVSAYCQWIEMRTSGEVRCL